MPLKIVIFIKSFNDADHILPYIDYLVTEKKDNIVVSSFEESITRGSFSDHANYLKAIHGINIDVFDERLPQYIRNLIKIYRDISRFKSAHKNKSKYFIFLLIILVKFQYAIKPIFKFHIFKGLKSLHGDIFIIDMSSEAGFWGRFICLFAQMTGKRIICLLHGYGVTTNLDTLPKAKLKLRGVKKLLNYLSKPNEKRIYPDKYLVGIRQRDTVFRSIQFKANGFEDKELDRVVELGIPRFTRAWNEKFKKVILMDSSFKYGKKDKINLVFFITDPRYNGDINILYKTLFMLSKLNNINLVYKPHTRTGLEVIEESMLTGFNASNVNSIVLSDWADVGIVSTSSISMQLMIDSVPIIEASYLSSNTTILKEMNTVESVGSIDQLETLISGQTKKTINNLIRNGDVNDFISQIVYGSSQSYSELMEKFYYESTN